MPFGRYRLVELLGRGGMGEVWRAYDPATDRIVAIKVLPAHLSHDETFQQRFRREAHAAARLNSPHVIPIHFYGEIDGRLYVDMRLIEGRDLQRVLADGPLEPAQAVRIIEEVATALHAAHKVGLLHRDVKPSNILLDENDFAYLIDFGIARAAGDTRLTSEGKTIGTFAYIAPERLGIPPEEDARADIYSLACVLYECLTGHPPFDADAIAPLIAAHLHSPPPQPSTTQPNVPAQIDPVIATGMAKNPDNRYATTVEFADAAREAITVPIPRPTVPAQPPTQPASVPAPPGQSTPTTNRPPPHGVSISGAPQQRSPQGKPAQPRGKSVQPPHVPTRHWQRPRTVIIVAAAVLILAMVALIVGRIIIRSNYYVGANGGTVVIMRGIQGSLLGYPLQEPHLLGCINGNDLSLISVDQSQNGCRLLRVDDLNKSTRRQVVAGLPAGSLDDAINQMHKLAQQLMPLCAPEPPLSTTGSSPAGSSPTALPPAPPEPGIDCRKAA